MSSKKTKPTTDPNHDSNTCNDCSISEQLWEERYHEVQIIAEDILNRHVSRYQFVSVYEYLLHMTRPSSERIAELNGGEQ